MKNKKKKQQFDMRTLRRKASNINEYFKRLREINSNLKLEKSINEITRPEVYQNRVVRGEYCVAATGYHRES